MKKNYSYSSWTRHAVLSTAAFFVAATAAHAQGNFNAYSTGFDGTDTVNGNSFSATYNSPAADPTDPLSGQKGWTSNDAAQTGGGTTQLVGQSDFVGTLGYYTGQNGALGGVYRTTTPTVNTPDVVPSTSTGGLINLFHPAVVPAASTFVSFNVDFAVTTPNAFTNRDTFGFSLANAAGVSIVSFNFSPSTTNAATNDRISYTAGGTTFTPSDLIALNGTYHLSLTINKNTGLMTATINNATFSAPVTAAAANSITQVGATWNVGDKTTLNGTGNGYQNADDNYLIFDNLAVTVPEPSTYAMMALGLVGMVGVLRMRRQQA